MNQNKPPHLLYFPLKNSLNPNNLLSNLNPFLKYLNSQLLTVKLERNALLPATLKFSHLKSFLISQKHFYFIHSNLSLNLPFYYSKQNSLKIIILNALINFFLSRINLFVLHTLFYQIIYYFLTLSLLKNLNSLNGFITLLNFAILNHYNNFSLLFDPFFLYTPKKLYNNTLTLL